ncbi:MAG: hypothetical protein JO214_02375 [Frankiaceae bacterium]|nr:hypothetical protein [Frankiaceae bacterium]
MSVKSFVSGVVIEVIEDERTQAVAEKLAATVIVKYVAPLIAPAIATAVDKAFDRITDLNRDGKPDVQQVAEAAHDTVVNLLPPWLRGFVPAIPGL